MTIYNYIALKNNKDIVKGKVDAADLREARESIRKLGFIPTKYTKKKRKATIKPIKKMMLKPAKLKSSGFKIVWTLLQRFKFLRNQVYLSLNH